MKKHSSTAAGKPSHDEIAILAYELFTKEGCVDGHHLDHWLRAETLLNQRTRDAAPAFLSQGASAARSGRNPVREEERPLDPPASTYPREPRVPDRADIRRQQPASAARH